METVVRKLYEAMFLIDSAKAAADWDGVNTTIKNILERAEAEIVSIKKWDECKLAYGINGKTRGTYILCYFRTDGEMIREIERDVQLSERIMRVLILSAEHMTEQDIETLLLSCESKKGDISQKAGEMVTQKDTPGVQSAEPAAADSDEPEQGEQKEAKALKQADEQSREEAEAN